MRWVLSRDVQPFCVARMRQGAGVCRSPLTKLSAGWTHKVGVVEAEGDILQDGPHTGAGAPAAFVPHEEAPAKPSTPVCRACCVPLYDCVLQPPSCTSPVCKYLLPRSLAIQKQHALL